MDVHQTIQCARRFCSTKTNKPRAAPCIIFTRHHIWLKKIWRMLKIIKLPRGPPASQVMLLPEKQKHFQQTWHNSPWLGQSEPATTRWKQNSFIKSEGVIGELQQHNQQEQVDGGTGAAEGVVHSSYVDRIVLTLSSEVVYKPVSLVYKQPPTGIETRNSVKQEKPLKSKKQTRFQSCESKRDNERRNYCDIKFCETHEVIKLQAKHWSHATSVFHYKLRFAFISVIYWVSILFHEIQQQIKLHFRHWVTHERTINQAVNNIISFPPAAVQI